MSIKHKARDGMNFCKSTVFFSIISLFNQLYPSNKIKLSNSNEKTIFKNAFIGTVAASAEAVVNQPVVFVKNALQTEQSPSSLFKSLLSNPKNLYRGLGVNLFCMVPSTAIQMAIDGKLKNLNDDKNIVIKTINNGIVGFFSGIVCTPSELIVINQQKYAKSPLEVIHTLQKEHGLPIFMRGFIPKTVRDGVFVAGFLNGYPQLKNSLGQKVHPFYATVSAIALVALPTAAVSHPFDTISTRMQANLDKKELSRFINAYYEVIDRKGKKALFAGLTPRMLRIAVAIPLMSFVKDYLNCHI